MIYTIWYFVIYILLQKSSSHITRSHVLKDVVKIIQSSPHCVLSYDRNDSLTLKSYRKAVKRVIQDSLLEDFQFGYHKVASVNTVKCIYVGSSAIEINITDYKQKKIYKWFKYVVQKSYNSRIPVLKSKNFKGLVNLDDVYIVVGVPGDAGMILIEKLLFNFQEYKHEVDVQPFIIPPHSHLERELIDENIIDTIPMVRLFYQKHSFAQVSLVDKFRSIYDITKEHLKIAMLSHKYRLLKLNSEMLGNFLLYPASVTKPFLMFVYISHQSESYRYIHAFFRAHEHFSIRHPEIQFYTLDIANQDNSNMYAVFVKHIPKTFPYIVFVQNSISLGTRNDQSLKQIPLNISIPSPHNLEMALVNHGVLKMDDDHEKVFQMPKFQCSYNTTYCLFGDQPLNRGRKKLKVKKKMKTRGGLQIITSKIWDDIFSVNHKQSTIMKSPYSNLLSYLTMVIFISEECSFCKIALKEFQRVAKSVRLLPQVSVYLLNCSTNHMKCKEHHVTGYPTILLFRHFTAHKVENCISWEHLSSKVQVAYHGAYEHDYIMAWLSSFTPTNMHILKTKKDSKNLRKIKNFNLIGTFYSKKYARRYLPERYAQSLIPLSCFQLMCELFYADADCYVMPRDMKVECTSNDELYLTSLQMKRVDNYSSTLYDLNTPMSETLKEYHDQHWPGFTEVHKKHAYDAIEKDFHCESDHRKCFDIIIDFIEDHSRLPITSVTMEMFHSHKKCFSHLWKRPILLTLVYNENMTSDSVFYQDLYKVALQLYDKINVAVLDVEQHPLWAQTFTPIDYYMHEEDDEVLQLNYPRFCLISLDDHSRAAFFPKLHMGMSESNQAFIKDRIPMKELDEFISGYLMDRKLSTVEIDRY